MRNGTVSVELETTIGFHDSGARKGIPSFSVAGIELPQELRYALYQHLVALAAWDKIKDDAWANSELVAEDP